MEVIIKICSIIGTIISICIAYKFVFIIIGVFFKKKRFKPTENKHSYAILVSARNEAKVIKNFLESVYSQDYPKDKLSVFVIAHNCTDNTAQIVRKFAEEHIDQKIVAYEYNNPEEKTKGFALKHLVEQINKDYGIECFEGYFVFDADNLLLKNYVTKMNEAFDEGNKIVTSFRHSKNLTQNWLSFSYAMHWMRTCLYENRARALLKQSCRVQGTGFLFANELVKDGWKYTSLTEDREFCTDAVIQNYRISYCDDAIFYDEQPYKVKVSCRQLTRWGKGHLLSSVKNCPKLIRNFFRRSCYFPINYDMFWVNFPINIEAGIRTIISFSASFVLAVMAGTVKTLCKSLLLDVAVGVVSLVAFGLIQIIPILVVYRKRIGKLPFFKTIFYMMMTPMFDILSIVTMWIALFKKIEWKPTPHDKTIDINELNTNETI